MAGLTPWVWSPEAAAMEDGQKVSDLDRVFRQKKVLSAQEHDQALIRQQQAQQADLHRMMYGKQLDAQERDREAGYGADALDAMIKGNPSVGKLFGAKPAELGWGDEEGAGVQSITPATTPSKEQLRGWVKAMPGIGQAVFNKGLESSNAQNKLIATDKPIYNPETGQWIMPPEGAPHGLYSTYEEARAKVLDIERANPSARGRLEVTQTEKGWKLAEKVSEPIGNNPLNWITELHDPRTSAERKKVLQQMLKTDEERQAAIQGAKNRQALPTPEMTNSLQQLQDAKANLSAIAAMDPAEKKLWVGFGGQTTMAIKDVLKGMAGVPVIGGHIAAWGGEDAALVKYGDFQAKLGSVRKALMFVEAGKQLTGIEKEVVESVVPTGKESLPMFNAKVNRLMMMMPYIESLKMLIQQTPKEQLTPEFMQTIETRYRERMKTDLGFDPMDRDATLRSLNGTLSPAERVKQRLKESKQ